LVVADDVNLCALGLITRYFVEEFEGLAWFGIYFEAEGLGRDAEVQTLRQAG
jgi:hypothetical protein